MAQETCVKKIANLTNVTHQLCYRFGNQVVRPKAIPHRSLGTIITFPSEAAYDECVAQHKHLFEGENAPLQVLGDKEKLNVNQAKATEKKRKEKIDKDIAAETEKIDEKAEHTVIGNKEVGVNVELESQE